jgi:hypothetical protein
MAMMIRVLPIAVKSLVDEVGLRIEIVSRPQPRFPDRRIAGTLGEFPVPTGQFSKSRCVGGHMRPPFDDGSYPRLGEPK